MRKHSRSFIIYIFFGIIIAVFVINFGPQSQGCSAKTSYAGQINGEPLTVGHLTYALAVTGFGGSGMSAAQMERLRAYAVDRLVVRELLATRANELGLRISDEKIRDMLLSGRYLALGMERRLFAKGEQAFDYERFSKFVRFNWRITVRKFKEQQRRELLAQQMIELLKIADKVSPEEAQHDFVHRNTRTMLSYVRLDPKQYQRSIDPTAAQVESFAKKEAEEIKKRYEANKVSYTNRPEELELRVIAIEHDKAGGAEAAQKQAEMLRKQLESGGAADFPKLAKQYSDHGSAQNGGLVGWVRAEQPGFGTAATEALKTLADGRVSAPIVTDKRTLLFRIDGRRKGDLSLEQVQLEIARRLLVDRLADEKAKTSAEAYIKQLLAGKKALQLFASDEDSPQNKDAAEAVTAAEAPKPQPDAPKLQSTAAFERSAEYLIPGIGISEELTQLAFSLKAGSVVDHPVNVGGVYYLVIVKEREDADMKQWKNRRTELVEEYAERSWMQDRREIEADLCEQAVKDKRVEIDPRALSRGQEDQDPNQPQSGGYVPCQTLRML